jgi:hypothetical protein
VKVSVTILLAQALAAVMAVPAILERRGLEARTNIYPEIKYEGDTEAKRDLEARTNIYPEIKYEGDTDTKRDLEAQI